MIETRPRSMYSRNRGSDSARLYRVAYTEKSATVHLLFLLGKLLTEEGPTFPMLECRGKNSKREFALKEGIVALPFSLEGDPLSMPDDARCSVSHSTQGRGYDSTVLRGVNTIPVGDRAASARVVHERELPGGTRGPFIRLTRKTMWPSPSD